MTNNLEILLMVVAVNGCVLGLAATALFFLNRAIDGLDRSNERPQLAAPGSAPRSGTTEG
jgi:hypothetical protein